jgi:acyl-CoA thioester hydrolase
MDIEELATGDFTVHRPVEVRFRDLDAMGHVNNAAYLTYFEIAREAYAHKLGHCPVGEDDPRELFPFILLEVTCRYLAPAGMNDHLLVHARVPRIGTRSFELQYLITRGGDGLVVASGRSAQVYFDYATGETRPLSDDFVARIEALERRSLR